MARSMDETANTITESGKKLETMVVKPTYSYMTRRRVQVHPGWEKKEIRTERFRPSELVVRPERMLNNGKAGIKLDSKEIDLEKINKEKLNCAGLKFDRVS